MGVFLLMFNGGEQNSQERREHFEYLLARLNAAIGNINNCFDIKSVDGISPPIVGSNSFPTHGHAGGKPNPATQPGHLVWEITV
jgi:hypothetical protein